VWVLCLALSLAWPGLLSGAEPAHGLPPASWWPEWRHDGHRSGRSDLAGAIKQPAEHWRYFLGAQPSNRVDDPTEKPAQDVYDLDGKGGTYRVQVEGNIFSVIDAKLGTPIWQFQMKVRKDGYLVPMIADFDPAQPGLEVAIWPVDGNYFGDNKDLAYCFSFGKGAASGSLLWTAEPPVGKVHAATLMVTKVRQGGGQDLVVMAWDGVTVWNGATGKLERRVEWPAIRHYGLGTCVRFPTDGPLRVVNIADYVAHVQVAELGSGPDSGKLLWERHYAKTNELSTVLLRMRPNSWSISITMGCQKSSLTSTTSRRT
jgi:hypothetical protein